jgi:hypothetical protein
MTKRIAGIAIPDSKLSNEAAERELTKRRDSQKSSLAFEAAEHRPAEISPFELNLFRNGRLDFDQRAAARVIAQAQKQLQQAKLALDTDPQVTAEERATRIQDWVTSQDDLFDWLTYVNGEVPANWAEQINIIATLRQARKEEVQLSERLLNAAILHPSIYVRTSVAMSQGQYLNEHQQALLDELGMRKFDQEHKMRGTDAHTTIIHFEQHIADVQKQIQSQSFALVA